MVLEQNQVIFETPEGQQVFLAEDPSALPIHALETPDGLAVLADDLYLGRVAKSAQIEGPGWAGKTRRALRDFLSNAVDRNAYAESIVDEAYEAHEAWQAANPNWGPENELIKLRKQAFEDALTNLLNVGGMGNRIKELMAWAGEKPKTRRLVVLGLDMDGFKSVNDSLGHDVGDEVLVDFANHLRKILRADADIMLSLRIDTAEAARPGGDEFLVIACIDEDPAADATETERRRVRRRPVDQKRDMFVRRVSKSMNAMLSAKTKDLRERCAEHERIDNMQDLGVSVGVAWWDQDTTPAELLRRADNAMYAIKRGKKEVKEAIEQAAREAAEAAEREERRRALAADWESLGSDARDLVVATRATLGRLVTQGQTVAMLDELMRAGNTSGNPDDEDTEVVSK